MRPLIIGTGSIGERHIRNLQDLDAGSRFILLRDNAYEDAFSKSLNAEVVGGMEDALSFKPDFAVVATPSARHIDALIPLIEAHMPFYTEKPLVTSRADVAQLRSHLNSTQYSSPNLVGCNLRFLPSLCKVREVVLSGNLGKIVRAQLTAGQWLPDWRPDQDYRESYSSKSAMGGGVVMDLIHEIDMARWLFGEFDTVRAITGKFSSLEIDSEDTAGILLKQSEGGLMVSLSLDYVSRRPIRRYEIVGENGTLLWDLQEKNLDFSGPQGSEPINGGDHGFDVAETYRTAMKTFIRAVQNNQPASPDMVDGLKSVELALTAKEEGQR